MKRYNIEIYKSFEKATIYTIHENGKENSETDDFLLRFKDDPKFARDVEKIIYWIKSIGQRGALERNFRPEQKAVAIPIEVSGLRLYGYRVNDEILILGNGGEKTSQSAQGSPDAYPHFKLMNNVAFIFNLKVNKQEFIIDEGKLKGDLSFFVN